jgi:ABC-type lipoprotein release transport system permease subunit
MPGMIAGFTDRINSILVPESFLEYANKNFGNTEDKGVSRLVLLCNDPSDAALTEFLQKGGYETNLEMLKNGKLNALLKMILNIVLLIGSVIILLAILGFIQYAQLLISHSTYEIKTLLQLGYRVGAIFRQFMWFYTWLMLLVFIAGAGSLMYIKHLFNTYMSEKNFEVDATIEPLVLVYGMLLVMLFLLLNAFNTYRRIVKLAKPQ